MRVLYLSAWYPTDKDQMAGLFVKKHADAVRAQGVDVKVWGYEPIPRDWRPDLIQLNVLSLKNALLTYWLHLRYRVPYIIVEHWTRYMQENAQFLQQSAWILNVLRFVASRATGIYTVSDMLREAMQQCGIINAHWGHVENIVDEIFYCPYTPQARHKIQLVHVSCFIERAKNVKGLLRAVKKISAYRTDFELTLIGNGPDWESCVQYAKQISVPENRIHWTGEISPIQVRDFMQQSDVHILASRYESYGIPLAEAMAVGIPSIETDSCGLRISNQCGISIPIESDEAIEKAIVYMLDHHQEYVSEDIRKCANRFSAQQVGKDLVKIYESTLLA